MTVYLPKESAFLDYMVILVMALSYLGYLLIDENAESASFDSTIKINHNPLNRKIGFQPLINPLFRFNKNNLFIV